jgi:hypothetical protein
MDEPKLILDHGRGYGEMQRPRYVTLADGSLAQVIYDSDVPIDKVYLLRRAVWPAPDPAEARYWCSGCQSWHYDGSRNTTDLWPPIPVE